MFIYAFEANPAYAPLARDLLADVARGRIHAATSTITLMEILVQPLRLGLAHIAEDYAAILAAYPNLALVDVDRDVARRAAELRARHRLSPPDSLQVATALHVEATAFVTNDRRLRRVAEIPVLILEDFVASAG